VKVLPLCVALLCASLAAQTVSVSGVLNQPLTVTVVDANGTPLTRTTPGGTPVGPPPTTLVGPGNTSFAIAYGTIQTLPTSATLQLGQALGVGPMRSASAGPVDVLFQLTATAPTAVTLQVMWFLTTPGTGTASVQVDVHNDGTIEYTGRSGITVPLGQFTLTPVPLVVRVTMLASATAGVINNAATLTVLPVSAATIQSTTLPCEFERLEVLPAFDGSLQLTTSPDAFQVLVMGLSATPTPLPLAFQPGCLLIPSPDAMLTLPPTGQLRLPTQRLHGTPLWLQTVAFYTETIPSNSVFVYVP